MNVLPSPDAAAEFAAGRFAEAAREAIGARGQFIAALAGGTTPRLMYATLAGAPFAALIDWSNVVLLWSDERCVPPDSPASNYGMVRDTLLSRVPIAESNVHRIRGEDEPAVAAEAYERELRSLLGRPIDFALLGLGDDGHTASLFPRARASFESTRWVEPAVAPSEPRQRITLTPLVLNAAAEIMFLVTGSAKASILSRVVQGPHLPHQLPAQLINPASGNIRWVIDAAAAGDLNSTTVESANPAR